MKKIVLLMAGVLAVALAGSAQAATMFAVQDSGANDKMVVDSSGRIGIGSTVPQASIHIDGITNATASDPSSQIRVHSVGLNGALNGGGILGLHNGPAGAYPLNGDRLGYFLFGTQTASGGDLSGAGFGGFAKGNWSDVSQPTALTFETTDVTGGRRTRMVVAPNGNLSIGWGANIANQALEVVGGVKLTSLFVGNPARNPVKPLCNATDGPTSRGTFWFNNNGAAADLLQICIFDGTNYGWKNL